MPSSQGLGVPKSRMHKTDLPNTMWDGLHIYATPHGKSAEWVAKDMSTADRPIVSKTQITNFKLGGAMHYEPRPASAAF
jgi:hypothetical protein